MRDRLIESPSHIAVFRRMLLRRVRTTTNFLFTPTSRSFV